MKRIALISLLLTVQPALAEILVPSRTIRAKEILTTEDFVTKDIKVAGAVTEMDQLIGQEARVALYPGRPIRLNDIGPPAIIDRNDLVTIQFDTGRLTISTEGRALGRGAIGDVIRVMNLTSRTTVFGQIQPNGIIEVN